MVQSNKGGYVAPPYPKFTKLHDAVYTNVAASNVRQNHEVKNQEMNDHIFYKIKYLQCKQTCV